jgi:DNA invertase Pin-like site-specific DNA recombinase
MPTTALYVRVSTTGQNEQGQKRELEAWAKGNGITDIAFYIDNNTGNNLDRPAFQRLQADIFNGTIQTIVVWKLDRLSRSIRDGINTLCEWCDKGLRVVSTTQQIDFNGTTGKLIASVLFAVSQLETETRKERQSVGIALAQENGVYQGRKQGTTKGKPARALELKQRGLTLAEIGTAMGISKASVCRYLRA